VLSIRQGLPTTTDRGTIIDEDLSAMYLSAKKAHQPRGLTDHEELEMLLESFSKQVEEIVSELETMTVSLFRAQNSETLINS
jgi:magnesium transporter